MEPILRSITNKDWITGILFASLLIMVIAKSFSYSRFSNFMILPFNNKYIFMYNKKDRLLNWFHVFFTLFLILNFSLFIYLAMGVLFKDTSEAAPYLYPIILGLVVLFIFLKVVLQLGNGFVFNTSKMVSEFIFKKLSYLNYSGILFFLANIILTYIAEDSKPTIYLTISLILSINGIGWITVIRNHQKFITSNFFYFILYLCALEIAPIVIIGSYLKD
ncbi:DUF4271 domain-containing protein [Spongiimicrobium salis]|uniref:DUF4271 domain-containing protein n=1 Tax=Spongiimicrobium salis TaxID=1667022 RepID=UPI00374CEB66